MQRTEGQQLLRFIEGEAQHFIAVWPSELPDSTQVERLGRNSPFIASDYARVRAAAV